MPVEVRDVEHLDPGLVVGVVEQAELDALGRLGEKREVRPLFIPARAERERRTGQHVHARSSTLRAETPSWSERAKFRTSTASPRRSLSTCLLVCLCREVGRAT